MWRVKIKLSYAKTLIKDRIMMLMKMNFEVRYLNIVLKYLLLMPEINIMVFQTNNFY